MSNDNTELQQVLRKRVHTLQSEGKVEDAMRVAQTAVEAARKSFNEDSDQLPQLILTLLMVADLKRMSGDFTGAEQTYSEGLELGNQAPDKVPNLSLARLQSGLASLYDFTGREEEALPLYQEAISRFEQNDPPEQHEAAYLCNNVAMIYKQRGFYAEAEQYYLKALEVFKAMRGDSHPSVATVLNNLGGLYTSMEQPDQAREMHVMAMEIREKAFPKNHPDLGQSLCNLAAAYHQLNDFENARKHYEAALRLYEKNLDEADDDYTILTENYAVLLRDHGHEDKAEALEKRVEARLKQKAG